MPNETPRAHALFEEQIDCVVNDDRVRQAELYADDFVCEFPFATDRPRRIEGRETFLAVMRPLWERSRGSGAKKLECRKTIVETTDPDFVVAECTFIVELGGRTLEFPFVQFLRGRDGKIASIHEYFSPTAREEALRGR